MRLVQEPRTVSLRNPLLRSWLFLPPSFQIHGSARLCAGTGAARKRKREVLQGFRENSRGPFHEFGPLTTKTGSCIKWCWYGDAAHFNHQRHRLTARSDFLFNSFLTYYNEVSIHLQPRAWQRRIRRYRKSRLLPENAIDSRLTHTLELHQGRSIQKRHAEQTKHRQRQLGTDRIGRGPSGTKRAVRKGVGV